MSRDKEPTAADLTAIEAEWPVMAAELAVVDAEIAALSVASSPSPLDWRRIRRAEHQVLAARLRLLPGRRAERAPGAA
jgi:hypothetical protein